MIGEISIGRINCRNPELHNKIHIRIESNNSDLIEDIYVDPRNFALALTGLNCQECVIERRKQK